MTEVNLSDAVRKKYRQEAMAHYRRWKKILERERLWALILAEKLPLIPEDWFDAALKAGNK